MTSVITSKPCCAPRRTTMCHKTELLASLPKKIDNNGRIKHKFPLLSRIRMQSIQATTTGVATREADTKARKFTNASSEHYVPVFVMLQLDVISVDNVILNRQKLEKQLMKLRAAGVDGIMVDVWWGIVESKGPQQYDWSAYRDLFQLVQKHELKIQAIMSFHQCGGNVGDAVNIPLPKWVLQIGEKNPDIFYTNRSGTRNRECLSLGVDNLPLFEGQTAIQVLSAGWRENIDVAGENALSRYDRAAYNQILLNSRPNGIYKSTTQNLKLSGLTYLRLSDELLGWKNFKIFRTFVKKLHADQDYDPQYINLQPLKQSKPKVSIDRLLEVTKPIEPFPWEKETDTSIGGTLSEFFDSLLELFFLS